MLEALIMEQANNIFLGHNEFILVVVIMIIIFLLAYD